MLSETVMIRGREYRVTAKSTPNGGQMVARLVSMVRLSDNKILFGKI